MDSVDLEVATAAEAAVMAVAGEAMPTEVNDNVPAAMEMDIRMGILGKHLTKLPQRNTSSVLFPSFIKTKTMCSKFLSRLISRVYLSFFRFKLKLSCNEFLT